MSMLTIKAVDIYYGEHSPRWQYDCFRCKFGWSCGMTCECVLRTFLIGKMPPAERQQQVNEALISAGLEPEF